MLSRVDTPTTLEQVILWMLYLTTLCLSCNPGYLFASEKYHWKFNHRSEIYKSNSTEHTETSVNHSKLHTDVMKPISKNITESGSRIHRNALDHLTRRRRSGFGRVSGILSK